MSPVRACHLCGTLTDDWCPTCTAAFPERRNADQMTGDERAAELALWYGPLEIEFALMHQRIEELVGRPVWTHELIAEERLIEEARTRDHSKSAEVFTEFLKGKRAIVVDLC